jgi:hypothetical protein
LREAIIFTNHYTIGIAVYWVKISVFRSFYFKMWSTPFLCEGTKKWSGCRNEKTNKWSDYRIENTTPLAPDLITGCDCESV